MKEHDKNHRYSWLVVLMKIKMRLIMIRMGERLNDVMESIDVPVEKPNRRGFCLS